MGLVATRQHESAVENLARHVSAVERVRVARRVRQSRVPDGVIADVRWLRLAKRTILQLASELAQLLGHAIDGAGLRSATRRWKASLSVQCDPLGRQTTCRHPQAIVGEDRIVAQRREAALGHTVAGQLEVAQCCAVEAREHVQAAVRAGHGRHGGGGGCGCGCRVAEVYERLEGPLLKRVNYRAIDVLAGPTLHLADGGAALAWSKHPWSSGGSP